MFLRGGALAQTGVITTIPVGFGAAFLDMTPNGSKVYVPNQGPGTVSVIDTASRSVIKTIATGGSKPFDATVSPDGQEAWVTNRLSGTVSVIAVPTDTVVATINLGELIQFTAFTPDGSRAYVTSAELSGSVSIIDVASKTVVDSIVTNFPTEQLLFSPDGARGYLGRWPSYPTPQIETQVFDVSTKATVLTIPDVVIQAITPDGTRGWGGNFHTNTVSFVNLQDGTVLSTIAVASRPNSIVLSPDGSRLYVTNDASSLVTVIDTNTKSVIETVPVNNGAGGIDVMPDGSFVYVSNGQGGTVSVLGAIMGVAIDVKPGSSPNCFNLNGSGVIPVAILGGADFHVSDIDMGSLSFAGLKVRVRGDSNPSCAVEYSNDDQLPDLVCHFEDDPANWKGGSGIAELTGNLVNGEPFKGTDSICIVP